MHFFLHNCLILVRSTGIEDIGRYEKSLDFQGFFAIERQRGRQIFEKIYSDTVIVFFIIISSPNNCPLTRSQISLISTHRRYYSAF